jgi:hypothetical protein
MNVANDNHLILFFNINILIVYGIFVANTIVIDKKKRTANNELLVVFKLIKPEVTIDDVKKNTI